MMRYLVKELADRPTGEPVDGKVFKNVSAALQYLRKNYKAKRVMFGDKEANTDDLEAVLKERLSTVTVSLENGAGRKFAITAFEDVS